MIRSLALLGVTLPALAADGPDRHVLPEPLDEPACVVLAPQRGMARVHLPEGPSDEAVAIVVVGETIEAVGTELDGLRLLDGSATWRGTSCGLVDTTGRVVTPGLVEVGSQLGLVEVGLEALTRHADAGREAPIRASLRVAEAYDPDSTLIPVQRIEGITAAVIHPSGGRISGQAAAVRLRGTTQAEALLDPSVAVVADLGGSSRAEALRELREALSDAAVYARSRTAYDRGALRELSADRLDLEALVPVVRGQTPLVVHADRAPDVEALLGLRDELGIQLVILGGAEAWRHAEALARAEVPVVLDPLVYGPGGFDQVHGRPDNAALLHEAGVPILLSTFQSHNARTLRQVAGNAVRGGLPHDAAIEALTLTPVQVFDLGERGRIAPGQRADLVVWSGDPLEVLTSTEAVLIDGQPVPLDSRQWQLYRRYRELPGTPPPSLPLPDTP